MESSPLPQPSNPSGPSNTTAPLESLTWSGSSGTWQQEQQVENFLQLALDAAQIGCWEWNLQTNQITGSTSWYDMLGLDPQHYDSRFETFLEQVHPLDRNTLLKTLIRCTEQNEPYELEFRLVRDPGEIRWILAKGKALLDALGTAVSLAGVNVDITDRKHTEESLRLQSMALEASANGIVITDRQGLILWVNPAFCRLTGYSLEEAIGKNPRELVKSGLHDPSFYENLWQTILTGQTWRGEMVNRRKDGSLYTEEMTITPVLDPHRDISHFIAIKQDISDRKQLEAERRQTNEQLELQIQERTLQLQQSLIFEALLKRISDGVRDSLDENQILETVVRELVHGVGAISCHSGLYDFTQNTSTILYEYRPSGLLQTRGTVVPMAAHSAIYEQLLDGETFQFCPLPHSLPFPSPNGPTVSLICPIMDDQAVLGDLWLYRKAEATFQDVEINFLEQVANQCAIALRQSRLYQAAQQQVEALERLNRLKDDFLSTVSHELRTPISNIKMATQMLKIALQKNGVLETDQRIQQYCQILSQECQREISLINDLLDLARLDAGSKLSNTTVINLQQWLPQIISPFVDRAKQQEQTLLIRIPEDLPAITLDVDSLERIVSELMQNACKYTPAGEAITLDVDLPTATPSYLQVSVQNTGVEIPATECDRIFNKFYRIPNNDPWKHGGTGLGLALVKKLVEHLDGTIHVECGHQMIVFVVRLPLHQIDPDTQSSLADQPIR